MESLYVRSSIGKRGLSFFINLILLSVGLGVIQTLRPESMILGFGFQLTVVMICIFFDKSPGNHVLNLKLLDDNKKEVGLRRRMLRNLPIILFFGVFLVLALMSEIISIKENKFIGLVFYNLIGIISIFIFANNIAVFFNKENKTLMDMKLNTSIWAYPSIKNL